MSANDESGGGLRTVTPLSQGTANEQMDAIGWLIFITMAIVLLPLLPVLVVLWVVMRLLGR